MAKEAQAALDWLGEGGREFHRGQGPGGVAALDWLSEGGKGRDRGIGRRPRLLWVATGQWPRWLLKLCSCWMQRAGAQSSGGDGRF